MKDLFMPDEVDEDKLEDILAPKYTADLGDSVILLSSGNKLHLLEDFDSELKDIASVDKGVIFDMVVHGGALYYCGGFGIKKLFHEDFENSLECWSLESHNGKLFAGTPEGDIVDVFDDKIVASYSDSIRTLCSHGGRLFAACDDAKIYRDFDKSPFAEREDWVTDLCSHNSKLYDCGDYSYVYDTVAKDYVFCSYSDDVGPLFSHMGGLYGVVQNEGISNLLDMDKACVWEYEYTVYSAISIPKGMVGRLL